MSYLHNHPKSGVWYFRRAIPAAIRPHIGYGKAGKVQWLESLQTKDLAAAKKRAKVVGLRTSSWTSRADIPENEPLEAPCED
ncbi:DUF6538 domain-containing protein [Azospirillum halopraeferens]|uniref:DUF6538 domain-containing protein n=1 Tax=Azospirillum halopraeferens TaxID=34010 RepID=UPI003CCB9F14